MKSPPARAFTLGCLIALSLMVSGWLLLLNSLQGRPHAHNQWVEKAYAHKAARAAQEPAPRILVIAGSGAMFGIDSTLLGSLLGRPVVNLGVNAGVLSPYIIHYARQNLRRGDWVILPLEYPLYHDEQFINRQFIDYYLSQPLPIVEIGWGRWLKVVWSAPVESVFEAYRGLPANFTVAGLYGPHNLDARGDQLNSGTLQRTEEMRAAVASSPAETYGRRAQDIAPSWHRWRALAQEIENLGGCAVFIPPAMLFRASYRDDGVERTYYENLPRQARRHGLRYVGRPMDFMYEESAFFDTNFHLTSEMRTIHTQRVATTVIPVFRQACPRHSGS